jgi:hypothetical protein
VQTNEGGVRVPRCVGSGAEWDIKPIGNRAIDGERTAHKEKEKDYNALFIIHL